MEKHISLDIILAKLTNQIIRNEKCLKDLILNFPGFAAIKDESGKWLLANDYGLNLFELDNSLYIGRKDSQLAKFTNHYYEALNCCEISDQEAWEGKKILTLQETIIKPDGNILTFDTVKIPIFNRDGSKNMILVLAKKIGQ